MTNQYEPFDYRNLKMNKYKAIKQALDKRPTPGPWAYEPHGDSGTYGIGVLFDEEGVPQTGYCESGEMDVAETVALDVLCTIDAAYISSCDPDTIRSLWSDLNEAIGLLTLLTDAVCIQAESANLEPILEKHKDKAISFLEGTRESEND